MNSHLLYFVLIAAYCSGFTHSANILFFFGVATYSHRVTAWPLVEELVARGHNVTFFSGFHPKNPNPAVKEIVPPELNKFFTETWETGSNLISRRLEGNVADFWYEWPDFGVLVAETIFTNPKLTQWVNESHYDLVIVDALFNDVGIGLAYKFNAPHIIFCPTAVFPWMYDTMGIPAETSWVPDIQIGYPQQMSLAQRIGNTLRPLYWYYHRLNHYFPKLDSILRKGFNDPNFTGLAEIEQDVSLIFVNAHFSIEFSRALSPLFVPVAGMHIKENSGTKSSIKQDMKTFLDESGDAGFIYISFGSAVQISKMSPEFQNVFFEAIRNSKTRFLWKWESEVPEGMPSNVFTSKWMPQQEILAHPKIRGFITHGGMGGIQEAVFNAVPLIVIPIFDEQDYNAERVHRERYGIRLHIETLTSPGLEDAIQNLLVDSSYSTKMTQVSQAFKDRQIHPLESAVWWTEYVLRHKDTPLLKSIGRNQSWYQRRLLDVWFILAFGIIAFLSIFVYIFALIVRKLSHVTNNQIKLKSS